MSLKLPSSLKSASRKRVMPWDSDNAKLRYKYFRVNKVKETLVHPFHFEVPQDSERGGMGVPLMWMNMWEDVNSTGVGITKHQRWTVEDEPELKLLSLPRRKKIKLGAKNLTYEYGQKQEHTMNVTSPYAAPGDPQPIAKPMESDSHKRPWYKMADCDNWQSTMLYQNMVVSKFTFPDFTETGKTVTFPMTREWDIEFKDPQTPDLHEPNSATA